VAERGTWKPATEGVPEAGAMGMLAGGVMGGGANVLAGVAEKPSLRQQTSNQSQTTEQNRNSHYLLAIPFTVLVLD